MMMARLSMMAIGMLLFVSPLFGISTYYYRELFRQCSKQKKAQEAFTKVEQKSKYNRALHDHIKYEHDHYYTREYDANKKRKMND